MGGIHEDVDFKQFEQLVLKDGGAETETVLVDFFATWCQPCKLLAPTLHKLAKDEALDVSLVSVDVDKNQQLAAAFGISAMPTIIAFRKGKPVSQFKGLLPEAKVREFIGAVKSAPLQ